MFSLSRGNTFRHATAEPRLPAKGRGDMCAGRQTALVDLDDGAKALVTDIEGDKRTVTRLESMGLHPGCLVCKRSQALNGGPVIVETGNTHLALGATLASRILVEPVDAR